MVRYLFRERTVRIAIMKGEDKMARIGGYTRYKFMVMDERDDVKLYNAKTEKEAIKFIIGYYSVNPSTATHLWVTEYWTWKKIGIVNRYGKYGGGYEYTYETTAGTERKVNPDGSFVKKRGSKTNQFGLDWDLKG